MEQKQDPLPPKASGISFQQEISKVKPCERGALPTCGWESLKGMHAWESQGLFLGHLSPCFTPLPLE